MVRSILLSFFFIVFTVLIIGVEHSYVDSFRDIQEVVAITLTFSMVNFLIDFVSLMETRWVMENVKRRQGQASLGAWICIDLVLSCALYLFSFSLIIGLSLLLFFDFRSDFSFMRLLVLLLAPDRALPFFVSTFGTSIIWYLLIVISLLVRMMSRASRAMEVGWQVIFDSDAPGRIIGMILGVFLIGIFLITKSVSWVFS